jgi:hypothetical protein
MTEGEIQTGQFKALLTGPVMVGVVERRGQVGIEHPARVVDPLLVAAVHQDENAEPGWTADGWLGMLSSSRPCQIAAKRP